jgi:hypothetical protein
VSQHQRTPCHGAGCGALRDFALRTLKAWAEELGFDEAVELLELEATDETLTEIAKSAINQQAQAAE